MRAVLLMWLVVALGCAGGATGESVRYLDWSLGAGYSLKHWEDRFVEEDQWFPAYEISFAYHFAHSWDIEFSAWAGRFVHPRGYYRIQSFVHTLSLRRTQPAGLGWWHLSVGAGFCDNDNVTARDAPAFKVAVGYSYPLAEPLNFVVAVGYIVNETHFVEEWQGDSLSLSVLSVTASLSSSF